MKRPFLKKKSQVLEEFKKFKSLVENQKGRKIKCIQSDNGKEYCNREFDTYLESCGITRRLTVPHTPEHNGIAERKNRTLVETARCMLIQAKLPASFWAEAIFAANHIRNRCPSSSIDGKTPFQLWNGKIPTVSYFRTFGCKAYFLNKEPGKDKFAPRAKSCIFIGYSEQCKGYRIWSPADQKVIVSRDVKFLEQLTEGEGYEEFLSDDVYCQQEKNDDEITYQNVDLNTRQTINDREIDEVKEIEMNESDDYVSDENVDEVNDEAVSTTSKTVRGRGRPRIVRTGNRGRPRKVYNEIDVRINEISDPEDVPELIRNVEGIEFHDNPEEYAAIADLSLKQAFTQPDSSEWREAYKSEISSIIENKTFRIIDRPKNVNVIGCKVVLKEKLKADGSVERKKARLVVQGYNQREGEDFNETFAPVVRISSIRTIMALAVEYDMEIHQLDVVTAFLNGDLYEKIYMRIPDEFEPVLLDIINDETCSNEIKNEAKKMLLEVKKGNKVCVLQKALYGLKQASRQWYLKLTENVRKLGMKQLESEPCVFHARRGQDLMILAIYVDDLWLASTNKNWTEDMKKMLMKTFKMKYLGKINYGLGIEFVQNLNEGKIFMYQRKYTLDVLKRFGMENSKPVKTPLEVGIKLQKPDKVDQDEIKKFPYQRLIGSLMYLAVSTRPDIAFAVNSLSQFNNCYTQEHWTAAKRILRYLKGTLDYGITFHKTGKPLVGYVDADWGNNIVDRRSYSGYVFILGGAAITWEARKQRTVALSSVEAEYLALGEATKEAIFLRQFLSSLGIISKQATVIYNDNQSSQLLVKNPAYHSRTKHIDIRHHFIRNHVNDNTVEFQYLPTAEMPADMLTKPLATTKHKLFTNEVGIGNHNKDLEDQIEGK